MPSFKYIISALAVAGSAAAASCSADTTTIQNAGDASAIGASCTTFTGTIAVATGTTDPLDFGSLREIEGSLIVDTAQQLPSLAGQALVTITETFSISNASGLNTLNFPFLNKVQVVNWVNVAELSTLTFSSGLRMVQNLTIQNTHLNTLTGINLMSAGSINIANNDFLKTVSMQVANVSDTIILSSNGKNVGNVSVDFPNLIWASGMTVENASSVSIPSLAAINGSLAFNGDAFSQLSAANLTSVGSYMKIANCSSLTNISFPMLTKVGGGLVIGDNSALKTINAFPQLTTVGASLDWHGNFTNFTLPQLGSVTGTFNVQSSGNISSSCDALPFAGNHQSVVGGDYTCQPTSDPTSGSAGENGGNTAGGNGGSNNNSGNGKTNAAATLTFTATTGMLAVFAAVFALL